jgi:hypothetical protein
VRFLAASAAIVIVQLVVIGIFQLRRLVLSALYDLPVSLQLVPMVGGKYFINAARNCKRARVPHEVLQVGCYSVANIQRASAETGRPMYVPSAQLTTSFICLPLQRLGPYLGLESLMNSRLVSRQWRDLLSPQVESVQIPASIWQYSSGGRMLSLIELLNAFPAFSKFHLHVEADKPCDPWCVNNTVEVLDSKLPLKAVFLRGFTQAYQWQATRSALKQLAPKLRTLCCEDACWPSTNLLPQLQQLSCLTKLHISSPQLSKINGSMISCLTSMTQLEDLKLIFRSAEGTAHKPLSFSPLSALTGLTALHVEYTGKFWGAGGTSKGLSAG